MEWKAKSAIIGVATELVDTWSDHNIIPGTTENQHIHFEDFIVYCTQVPWFRRLELVFVRVGWDRQTDYCKPFTPRINFLCIYGSEFHTGKCSWHSTLAVPFRIPFHIPFYSSFTCCTIMCYVSKGTWGLYPGLLVYMGYVHTGGALMYGFTIELPY